MGLETVQNDAGPNRGASDGYSRTRTLLVRLDRDPNGRWTFWLDRPGSSQNSLGTAALRELDGLLSRIGGDATCLVVRMRQAERLLRGGRPQGVRTFSDVGEVQAFAEMGGRIFERLSRPELPTVAILHGTCLGGGLELAPACSHRVVLSAATIGLPEVLLGLIPGWGATWRLPD